MALLLLGGCIVLSVYPFYYDKDLVADPQLAGRWLKAGTTSEFWQFTATGQKAFQLTTADANDTNVFTVHRFHLKQYQFLDLLTTNRHVFELPLHLVCGINRGDSNASLHFMDYGYLVSYLQTNPAALRHLVVSNDPDDTNSDNMVYLTATTRDLQVFLLKHAEDTNLFNDSSAVELNRVQETNSPPVR
jgi:hypothetical protein